MAEFKISRIRYTWKGPWTTSTAYIIDDVVQYGGSVYIALRGHTSATFKDDIDYTDLASKSSIRYRSVS